MDGILSLASANLLSPVVLFFALGIMAALARSDLTFPEAVAKGLALYLMLAIGFKGGVAVNEAGLSLQVISVALTGMAIGFVLPVIAYLALRRTSRLDSATAAAVAAHYGSISVVTFVAGTELLRLGGIAFDGHMVAVMALMETPAIMAGLWLASRDPSAKAQKASGDLLREVFLNGSVVLLMGAFAIGWITGEKGMTAIKPFIDDPFRGVLCLFMLDMGLIAGTRLRSATKLTWPLAAFAVYMPLIGATAGLAGGYAIGLPVGNLALLAILCASASYIAVPAAMRLALPQADPAVYLTLSLALTFPFNLTLGLPLYLWAAQSLTG
ncbi:MAG TPA: sodium-dependent bicarbonate transport family permease [Alphaproteobacteria bacterium]|nr:sodium-dependent bicarbonate transport family permease [Alphaproteobacteria bacterium]HAJ47070.1 sodium-dependent bicarbonate transport family permease [Alphaproteobacteria bacterium]